MNSRVGSCQVQTNLRKICNNFYNSGGTDFCKVYGHEKGQNPALSSNRMVAVRQQVKNMR
jgi:hypothetical protein